MKRDSLDMYDELPSDMIEYLKRYGRHFNKKLCKYAVSLMKPSNSSTGVLESNFISKEDLNNGLLRHNITLENDTLYDAVYVINMARNDFWGSSISDELHLYLYVHDVIDDVDGYDGIVFNRWYADMCRKGIPIDWEDYL